MKSWLRARKNDSAASLAPQSQPPPIDIKQIPQPQAHHDWDALVGSRTTSITGEAGHHPPPRPESAQLQPTTEKQTTRQLIESTAAHVTAEPLTHQQHITVRSEHYFRLALESWEQLRACHFKASQKFSLAEWMHIHALLLYGRIQAVRRDFNSDVAQHNRIDLSADVAVFEPLATVLSAIGVVQDKESGITYVPDAKFPAESQSRLTAYSANEMQCILDGSMYDWQRSWKRVLEARHLRDTKHTQYSLVRSSSELICAIREKSDLISRIQLAPQPKRNSIVLDDYKHELGQLQELLEEARNAKDYTIRPPCVRVYDRAEDTVVMEVVSSSETQPGFQKLESLDPALDTRTLGSDIPNTRSADTRSADTRSADARSADTPTSDFVSLDSRTLKSDSLDSHKLDSYALDSRTPSSRTGGHHSVISGSPNSPVLDFGSGESSSVEATSCTAPEHAFELKSPPHQAQQASPRGSGLPVSMKLPKLSLESSGHEETKSPPLRSAMRKGSGKILLDLSSRSGPQGPMEGSFTNAANGSDVTLKSDSPTKDSEQCSPVKRGDKGRLSPKRNHRVQLAGSADASDCFVHFDARIWEEYQAFVSALQSTRLTQFGSIKKEREGSYAWMLPVKLSDARGPQASHRSPAQTNARYQPATLQSTPLMSAPSRKQTLQIRLPRTSIPRTEQVLALLLQTSSAPADICDSWHVETKAELDMRQFVLDYVNTGIFDNRAM